MNNYLSRRIFLTLLAIIASGSFLYPNGASAITITPVRFEVSGDPGETLTQEMILINETDTTETYYSSFANFEAQGDSGSPAFVEPVEGLGTWMSADDVVVLAPRQQKVIQFQISIPQNAEPGGYFAVLFWGSSPAGQQGVAIGAKTGVLVLLSVNGEVREEAGLLDYNVKDNKFFHNTLPVSLEYRVRNDGGDRIKPQGKITIRNTVFLPTEKLDANPVQGNVLPNSTRKITVNWVNYERAVEFVEPSSFIKKFWSDTTYQFRNFALGLYSANLDITYGTSGEHAKETVFFFVFPWQLIIVLIIVLSIVFWGGKRLIKRYNRFIIEKARSNMKLPPEPFQNGSSI